MIPLHHEESNLESIQYNRPHVKIPMDDMRWMTKQLDIVKSLFYDCWYVCLNSSEWVQLTTILDKRNFKKAKKIIESANLFEFKSEIQHTKTQQRKLIYFVRNLSNSQ